MVSQGTGRCSGLGSGWCLPRLPQAHCRALCSELLPVPPGPGGQAAARAPWAWWAGFWELPCCRTQPLLCGTGLGQLLVWEWQSESYILKQQGHFNSMVSLAYSPDGQYIVTGGDDGKVGSCASTVRGPGLTPLASHRSFMPACRSRCGTPSVASALSPSRSIPAVSPGSPSQPLVMSS